MSRLRTGVSRLIAAVFATLMLATAGFAACSDFAQITLEDLAPSNIEEVQKGLRTAYRDSNKALDDGRLGSYTRSVLAKLCTDVPRPVGTNDVRSTLQLTTEYAQMEESWPGWAGDLFALDLTAGGDALKQRALALRLAGPVAMKTMAVGRRALAYDCADPGAALAGFPAGQRALATLTRLFRDKSEVEICQLLPLAGDVTGWQQAMDRLGQISGARVGALQVLQNPAFLNWVNADKNIRLLRLAGTVPAVLTLIDDYNAQSNTGATSYSGGPCSPVPIERTLTYYELNEKDEGTLDFLVSLSPKLDSFAEAQGGFDNPQSLWRALRPVLAEDLDACILAQIETLVKGPEKLPLAFLLKPAATQALMARKELETAVPVLTELATMTRGTKAELINRIKAGLQDVQDEIVGAEVTAAADTLAAASEPATVVTDTALIELDVEAGEGEPAPVITVTDATDQAVETAIDNPELADKLRNTPMADATVPELLRSQVRAALQETADKQAQRAVDAQIALIEPAVTSHWALTEALKNEILAIPYVDATIKDATAEGVQDRIKPIIGVSYPSYRLFNEALRTVSQKDGMVPFSQFVTERIVTKAQKTIDDPETTRVFGPLEIEKCDCAPERQSEDLVVYGFYPFWLAPPFKTSTDEEEDAAPQTQTQIDFGVVDQIAFYGLEFAEDSEGRVTLNNRTQWRSAKRQFINSAHKYRARADLAFDLRNWMNWDQGVIDDVVDDIVTEMAPFPRLEGYELGQVAAAVPTLFDPARPDGVTLIFHDYQGTGLGKDQMATMVRIIKSLYEALPNRDKLKINVGFDFPLVAEQNNAGETPPIFDELFELLQRNPYVLASAESQTSTATPQDLDRQTAKVIDKILLFMERPTTDAKKELRYRMEQGLFKGEVRREVLRSIIPVVPPSGHALVRTSATPGNPDRTEGPEFSQFDDDVVYFKDNFSGIGFWPMLDPAGKETAQITEILAKYFNKTRLPAALTPIAEPVNGICRYACPNRARLSLAALALFVLVVLLTWRSFYSGLADTLAFRFLGIGLVWIGNIILVAGLAVLAFCDPHSYTHDILLGVLLVGLGLLVMYNFIQWIKNGPMP